MQMPQLYLRGSFVNVTIRNLTEEQRSEVDRLVEEIKDDPLLQPSRYKFCSALRYTIKGDYNDEEAANQEYYVALWKAVVAAKHGWGTHEPSEETITNKIQRKKFFQTWIFNYLRQILSENKRSYSKKKCVVAKPVFEAAKQEVTDITSGKISLDREKECKVNVDLFLLSTKKIKELLKCKQKYLNKVNILLNDQEVVLYDLGRGGFEMIETTVPTLIGITSASRTEEEGGIPEIPAINTTGFSDPDTIEVLFENLSDCAQNVISIIINPPEDFIEKFGEKPAKRYIQEYLKLSPKQVKDVWSEMKMVYSSIVGIPD